MRALVDKQDALEALNEWEDCYTWDDWINKHKAEAKYKIISPSSVIQNMPTKPDDGDDWKKAYYENAYSQGYINGYLKGKKDQMQQKTGRWISEQDMTDKLTRLINEFEMILSDVREKEVDDSVCGLCEYDADHGMDGYANECPGFERDDCFKLKDEYRKQWMSMKW